MPFLIFGAQGSSESNELCSPKVGHINLNKFHKGNKMKGCGKSNHFCSMDLCIYCLQRGVRVPKFYARSVQYIAMGNMSLPAW